MRVGTFNLLHGMSPSDGRVEADRLADAVGALDADVLGLQEVDVAQARSGGVDQVALAVDTLGARWWCFAPSIVGTPGAEGWRAAGDDDVDGPRYGVALVSRLPVLRAAVTRFDGAPLSLPLLVPSVPRPQLVPVRDEPRCAIAAVVRTGAGPMTVVTAHLSFVPGWNVVQLRSLVRRLADWPRPLVLAGDLNLPGPLPARATGWTALLREPTYPSGAPKIQFDHLLADALPYAASARVHSLPVSDHAAVTVDLDLSRPWESPAP